MTGKCEDIYYDHGRIFYVISTDEEVKDSQKLIGAEAEFKISPKRGKRSLNANAYMWELCTLIADKLSDEGTLYTKEDIYRQTVKEIGVFRDIPMQAEYADTLRKAWEMHGTAWITEIVDYSENNAYIVRCYYGSSVYNTKQMSRLIESLIQDCDALGIEHRTQAEINNMLSLWNAEPKRIGENGK